MTEKKKKPNKKLSIEELYQNKTFVKPKEKNLETIFEEPRKARNGAPILTSVRKYKRYLHFDPTEGKIHKRKVKVKKMNCSNKTKAGKRTRSTSKKTVCDDISLYLLQAMGESSNSDMEQTSTDATDTGAMHTPNDSKGDMAQPNAIVGANSKTLQNPDQVLSDCELKESKESVTVSEKCKKIVETEDVDNEVSEVTEQKTSSRCILA